MLIAIILNLTINNKWVLYANNIMYKENIISVKRFALKVVKTIITTSNYVKKIVLLLKTN